MVLLASATPLSAYEIVDRYKTQFQESLPVMSVYRMLDFLIQEKLVHKLETAGQYMSCAHIACDHQHETPQFLICDRCGSEMHERNCKVTCPNCGNRFDCSDLNLYFD